MTSLDVKTDVSEGNLQLLLEDKHTGKKMKFQVLSFGSFGGDGSQLNYSASLGTAVSTEVTTKVAELMRDVLQEESAALEQCEEDQVSEE